MSLIAQYKKEGDNTMTVSTEMLHKLEELSETDMTVVTHLVD